MVFLGCPGSGGGATSGAKTAEVGAQSGTLTQGTMGMVTFTVATTNITGLVPVEVGNLPAGINASSVINIINNSGTLTLSGNAAEEGVYDNLTLTIDGVISSVFTLTVSGVTVGAKTISVGTQTGTLQATMAHTVTYTVITTNISADSYDATVNNIPTGVYVVGRVTIAVNGSGTLSLLGYPNSVEGVYVDLTLTLAAGGENITSNAFTLTIAAAPAYEIQDYDPYEMIEIPGGTFTMGSPEAEPGRVDNETQHEVTLTDFCMGKYQVTRAMWIAVTGEDPGYFPNHTSEVDEDAYLSYPAERIHWYAAIKFCNTLSIHEELTPAYRIMGNTDPGAWGYLNPEWDTPEIVEGSTGYRLPTEAQWEYACRAGIMTGFNWDSNYIYDEANCVTVTGQPAVVEPPALFKNAPTIVGSYEPNAWGLYDMHGNVWEWCWDWYGDYPEEPQTDPTGPETGSRRILRGGSCWDYSWWARSAARGERSPNYVSEVVGLRLVRPMGGE